MVGTMRKYNDGRSAAAATTVTSFPRTYGRQHDCNAAADGSVEDERAATNVDQPSLGSNGRHGQHGKPKHYNNKHPSGN